MHRGHIRVSGVVVQSHVNRRTGESMTDQKLDIDLIVDLTSIEPMIGQALALLGLDWLASSEESAEPAGLRLRSNGHSRINVHGLKLNEEDLTPSY